MTAFPRSAWEREKKKILQCAEWMTIQKKILTRLAMGIELLIQLNKSFSLCK
jgi:hypothetical protein